MARYAVVIPAYNEADYLPATLSALRKAMAAVAAAHSGRVVVVDNHSTDDTAKVARENGADEVVFEPVNQISRARNAGARAAVTRGAEWLIFLDADTLVPPETLARALAALDSGAVCGGGAITVCDGELPFFVRNFLTVWNWSAAKFGLAAGCFVYCTREGYEAAGGFSEAVYAGEEVWFSNRLRKWGRRGGLAFRVIARPPVVTSDRKTQWFGGARFTLQLAILLLFPFAARWRRLCGLWYRRPSRDSASERVEPPDLPPGASPDRMIQNQTAPPPT